MDVEPHTQQEQLDRRSFLRRATLIGLSAAAGLPEVSWAVRGRELHIRNYNDIKSLDPPFMPSGAEGVVANAMYISLMQFSAGGTWDSQLDAAEYFEQIDETHYAFRLKRGLMFTHGFGEVTADDVKFSLERVIDPDMNTLNAEEMGPLSHVEVTDRFAGIIVLHSPYAAFIPIALTGSAGAIMSRKAVTSVGGRFGTQPPCSSGPYMFKSWQAKRKTVLERNPLWHGEPAAFDEIHVYAMTDVKSSETAFEAGQLDCAEISVESTAPFKRNMPPDSRLEIYPSGRNYWLGMNQSNPALQDLRVRQAIQYAVDVEAVVEAAWFGLAAPSTGPVPAGMLGHRDRSLIPPSGDTEKARSLLRDAGVELPLKLRLDVNNDALELTAVQVIQWSLKKVGIEADIRAQDNGTFLSIGREDSGDQWQDVQLFFQSFVGGADPYYSLIWFVTEQMGRWNWERFSNAEFDSLSDRAIATTDPKERDQHYRRMQDLMEESGCYRFITNGVMPQIVRKSIEPAFQPDGYAILRAFRLADSTSPGART